MYWLHGNQVYMQLYAMQCAPFKTVHRDSVPTELAFPQHPSMMRKVVPDVARAISVIKGGPLEQKYR